MIPRVQVLLSSYNGEKYIKEQIISILNQKDVDVFLLIRDDGSKDSTFEEIERIDSTRIQIIKEDNIGSTQSFFRLILLADSFDYYAFADQDDIWDDDKLITGINRIKNISIPAVYSSSTRLVDANLKPMKKSITNVRTDIGSAIIKNYATGCTIIFNYELMCLLKKYIPKQVPYHDWWVNLVAISVGGISIFDTTPHISYRQHGNNVVGESNSFVGKWKHRLSRFLEEEYKRDNMAVQLLDAYESIMPQTERTTLWKISEYKKRKLDVIRDKRIRTNNWVDNLLFWILVIINKA